LLAKNELVVFAQKQIRSNQGRDYSSFDLKLRQAIQQNETGARIRYAIMQMPGSMASENGQQKLLQDAILPGAEAFGSLMVQLVALTAP
jgi:hypothetical protein